MPKSTRAGACGFLTRSGDFSVTPVITPLSREEYRQVCLTRLALFTTAHSLDAKDSLENALFTTLDSPFIYYMRVC